ncbi:hypothetical protein [Dyella lutea]|uniref:Tetratricopeptide repeat protein n=1 Tax=Dyella lutea TaxID=2950441 RepID=A0ABT1FDD9_9GAMM|nr:hypothetical protein [Dyella lutea]MCP1374088.1 hypothetical protein [Dyella lutea]
MTAQIFSTRNIFFCTTLIVCALIYWPALHGPFLFDDFPNLAALTSIDHVSSWRDLGIYLSQPRDFPGRPIAMLSFLLQKADWPDQPFPFKLVNLSLHLTIGLLVYLLARRMARLWLSTRTAEEGGSECADWAALFASAAWLLNPIQLSGVSLVVQRMTLLMALFTVIGLLAYLHGLLRDDLPAWRRGVWMALGLGACTGLAVLSKENGLLLPLYALVIDSTLGNDGVKRLPRALAWWRRLLIWPAVLLVLSFLFWTIPGSLRIGIRDFSLSERLLTEPRVLASYLGNIFLPRFGLYGLYHDDFVVSRGLLSPWTTLPALALVLAAAGAALFGRRRWPLFALAVLWYLGGQLLESSTIMLELYFEHRNYVPIIGPFVALGLALARMAPGTARRLASVLAVAWLAACTLTTALSARTYSSADRLALTWANTDPDSIRAQTFLVERLTQHGQLQAAMNVLDRAIRQYPLNSGLGVARVYLRCMQGTLDVADLDHLDQVFKDAHFDRTGFSNMESLRQLAFGHQCPALTPEHWWSLSSTLLANPAYAQNGVAAGFLHYQRHFWAVSQGNLALTIAELQAAYQNDPDAEIPRLEAKYLVSAGLYDRAIDTLQHADYRRLPQLRRLLVDDRAINAEDIATIRQMQAKNGAGH